MPPQTVCHFPTAAHPKHFITFLTTVICNIFFLFFKGVYRYIKHCGTPKNVTLPCVNAATAIIPSPDLLFFSSIRDAQKYSQLPMAENLML